MQTWKGGKGSTSAQWALYALFSESEPDPRFVRCERQNDAGLQIPHVHFAQDSLGFEVFQVKAASFLH